MKTFYIHVSLAEGRTETIVPITVENLDAANDWAAENYGKFGIEVTRIRLRYKENDRVSKVQIISLSAPRPQSGKDTLAEQIVQHFGSDRVATIAFGDYLRDCVSHLFGAENALEVRELLSDSRKDVVTPLCLGTSIVHRDYREFLLSKGVNLNLYQTPRFHMQSFGNDYIKGFLGLEDFWVDVVDHRIAALKRCKPNLKYIIVTDTRSPNEFEWLDRQGAMFYMIKRVGFPKDLHDNAEGRHQVETHADGWLYDHVLLNRYGDKEAMFSDFLTSQGL